MVPIPKAVRVRTSSGWQDIALVGPAGAAGGPIDAKSIKGQYGGAQGPFAGPAGVMQLYADAAGTIPMRLTFTPPVDAWLDANGFIGLVQKTDAAYHYLCGALRLTPADVDGVTLTYQYITQHASVNMYEGRAMRRMFKLAAGVTYTLDLAVANSNGGTWQYWGDKEQLYLEAQLFSRGAPLAPSGMLFTQVLSGQGTRNVNVSLVNGQEIGISAMNQTSARFTYTPPVDCWFEISYELNQVMRSVAGWKYAFIDLVLAAGTTPAIAGVQRSHVVGDQLARGILSLYGAGGSQYGQIICRKLLGLSAGVTYTFRNSLGAEDANFTTFLDDEQWQCWAKAWPR